MSPVLKSIGSAFMAVLLLAGCAAIAYARWTHPVAEADAALASADYAAALAGYGVQEARFDRVSPAKQFLTSEYHRVVANELWLLYHLQRFDETIDKAGRAPEGANPHFWAGSAFYDKARGFGLAGDNIRMIRARVAQIEQRLAELDLPPSAEPVSVP